MEGLKMNNAIDIKILREKFPNKLTCLANDIILKITSKNNNREFKWLI